MNHRCVDTQFRTRRTLPRKERKQPARASIVAIPSYVTGEAHTKARIIAAGGPKRRSSCSETVAQATHAHSQVAGTCSTAVTPGRTEEIAELVESPCLGLLAPRAGDAQRVSNTTEGRGLLGHQALLHDHALAVVRPVQRGAALARAAGSHCHVRRSLARGLANAPPCDVPCAACDTSLSTSKAQGTAHAAPRTRIALRAGGRHNGLTVTTNRPGHQRTTVSKETPPPHAAAVGRAHRSILDHGAKHAQSDRTFRRRHQRTRRSGPSCGNERSSAIELSRIRPSTGTYHRRSRHRSVHIIGAMGSRRRAMVPAPSSPARHRGASDPYRIPHAGLHVSVLLCPCARLGWMP